MCLYTQRRELTDHSASLQVSPGACARAAPVDFDIVEFPLIANGSAFAHVSWPWGSFCEVFSVEVANFCFFLVLLGRPDF